MMYATYSSCSENVCVPVERDTKRERESKHGKMLIGKSKWRV